MPPPSTATTSKPVGALPTLEVRAATITNRARLRDVLQSLKTLDTDLARTPQGLLISMDDCATLEGLLGPGACMSSEALVQATLRWAGITIGDVRLALSPSQLEEVQYRATKNGRTPEDEMRAAVTLIADHVFGSGYIAPPSAR